MLVRGADKNCRAKDPAACRYHGAAFAPLQVTSRSFEGIFEKVNDSLTPSLVIPAHRPNDDGLMERFSYEDGLGLEERAALHRYSDQYGSTRIRTILMNPDKVYDFNGESMDSLRSTIEILDRVVAEHSVDVSGVPLWRGVKEFKYELAGLEEGSVFTCSSFTATSVDPEVAVSFSSKEAPILLKVKARKGYRVAGQFLSEDEVLLKRGLSFRVARITENVHLEKRSPRFGEDGRVRGITLVEVEEIV